MRGIRTSAHLQIERNNCMTEKNQTRKRKVYYGYYDSPEATPHPVIKIGGKYLEKLGFHIGDVIEVRLGFNEIIINKKVPSQSN